MPGIIFQRIFIADIRKLNTGWKISLDDLSKVVNDFFVVSDKYTESDLNRWAVGAYGGKTASEDKKVLSRIRNFFRLSLSIKNNGYVDFLSCPEKYNLINEDNNIWKIDIDGKCRFETTPHSFLPRVRNDKNNEFRLDDGRHRVSILKALGVIFIPVVKIKTQNTGSKDQDKMMADKFSAVAIEHLNSFRNSKKWDDYKKTDCYKKIIPTV